MTRSKMMILAAALIATTAVAGLTFAGVHLASQDSVDHDHSDGAHDHGLLGDPVKDDVRVATEAHLIALRTWYPATQDNPVDAVVAMEDRLSGQLLLHAQLATPEPRPDLWEIWGQGGDYVQAFASVPASWESPENQTTVEVPVEFWQDVVHTDFRTTPWSKSDLIATMVWEDEQWKLAEYDVTFSYFYGDVS